MPVIFTGIGIGLLGQSDGLFTGIGIGLLGQSDGLFTGIGIGLLGQSDGLIERERGRWGHDQWEFVVLCIRPDAAAAADAQCISPFSLHV
jgi:hypothetical protein